MPGINFYEFFILVVLFLLLLGPERLPQYTQSLARLARKARSMAEDSKVRFKEETGAEFDDVDWQKYDPRQYDPRRIIRKALDEEVSSEFRGLRKGVDPRELFVPITSESNAGVALRSSEALASGAASPVIRARANGDLNEESLQIPLTPFDPEKT